MHEYKRATSGYLWHIVKAGERKALCGFEPQTKYNTSNRGHWLHVRATAPANNVCIRCEEKNEKGT